MNYPLTLYRSSTQRLAESAPLVSLTLVSAQVQSGEGGVQLRFDASATGDADFHCVWLEAAISDRYTTRRYYGRLEIKLHERPARDGRGTLTWLWRLLPEEFEALDAARAPSDAPVGLWLHVSGVVVADGVLASVVGDQQFDLTPADWQRIQHDLGYSVPPSQQRLLTPANLLSPPWKYSVGRLAAARGRLAAGEGYDAMEDVLNEFEGLVSPPYATEAWVTALYALPHQKAVGVAKMLSGYCTYLNKVGHHRDRSQRAEAGLLATMPIDVWEAEFAVAIGHYLLAYARRLLPSAEA